MDLLAHDLRHLRHRGCRRLGFFSKDEILASVFARGAEMPVYYLFYALCVVAAFLTAFYMARLGDDVPG